MRQLVLSMAAGLALLAATAPPTLADHIAPHQHIIVTPSGERVVVGPDGCAMGASRQFDEFHFNVHRGQVFQEAFTNPDNPVQGVVLGCP